MSLRPIPRAAAFALLALAAAFTSTPASAVPLAAPRTGHAHGPGGEPVRWCLADGPISFTACLKLCADEEIDVVVMEGRRFGLPSYNPMRCSTLESVTNEKES